MKQSISLALWLLCGIIVHAAEPEKNFDRFGGSQRIRREATGSFRIEKVGPRWMFVTPEGHGFVPLGVNHCGLLQTKDKTLLDYDKTAFFHRFGRDWPRVYDEVASLMRGWGFNCGGYDAPEPLWKHFPFGICAVGAVRASFYHERLDYTDVFDPAFVRRAEQLAQNAAERAGQQPGLLGLFWNDCVRWDIEQARSSHGTDWVSWIRALDDNAPGKQRYTAFAKEFRGDEKERDRAFLRLIARTYFQTMTKAFRAAAPKAVLFGDRFHLRDLPLEVLEEAAPCLDAIAIQLGDHHHPMPTAITRPDETWFDASAFDAIYRRTRKPILICDHQCSFFDPQTPQTGFWFQYPCAEEAAASYGKLLTDAFAKPYIVGYFRCQLITAWVDRAKHHKQGLLRPTGEPFDEYTRRISQTNRRIVSNVHDEVVKSERRTSR